MLSLAGVVAHATVERQMKRPESMLDRDLLQEFGQAFALHAQSVMIDLVRFGNVRNEIRWRMKTGKAGIKITAPAASLASMCSFCERAVICVSSERASICADCCDFSKDLHAENAATTPPVSQP